jgi:hypothetical protein
MLSALSCVFSPPDRRPLLPPAAEPTSPSPIPSPPCSFGRHAPAAIARELFTLGHARSEAEALRYHAVFWSLGPKPEFLGAAGGAASGGGVGARTALSWVKVLTRIQRGEGVLRDVAEAHMLQVELLASYRTPGSSPATAHVTAMANALAQGRARVVAAAAAGGAGAGAALLPASSAFSGATAVASLEALSLPPIVSRFGDVYANAALARDCVPFSHREMGSLAPPLPLAARTAPGPMPHLMPTLATAASLAGEEASIMLATVTAHALREFLPQETAHGYGAGAEAGAGGCAADGAAAGSAGQSAAARAALASAATGSHLLDVDALRAALLRSTPLALDWFGRSRTAEELEGRAKALLRASAQGRTDAHRLEGHARAAAHRAEEALRAELLDGLTRQCAALETAATSPPAVAGAGAGGGAAGKGTGTGGAGAAGAKKGGAAAAAAGAAPVAGSGAAAAAAPGAAKKPAASKKGARADGAAAAGSAAAGSASGVGTKRSKPDDPAAAAAAGGDSSSSSSAAAGERGAAAPPQWVTEEVSYWLGKEGGEAAAGKMVRLAHLPRLAAVIRDGGAKGVGKLEDEFTSGLADAGDKPSSRQLVATISAMGVKTSGAWALRPQFAALPAMGGEEAAAWVRAHPIEVKCKSAKRARTDAGPAAAADGSSGGAVAGAGGAASAAPGAGAGAGPAGGAPG